LLPSFVIKDGMETITKDEKNKKLNIYHRKNKHQVFQGTEKNALNIAFGCTNRTLSFYFPRGLP
jgi:hypothetical protein